METAKQNIFQRELPWPIVGLGVGAKLRPIAKAFHSHRRRFPLCRQGCFGVISGSFAILLAMRRASSSVIELTTCLSERLLVSVLNTFAIIQTVELPKNLDPSLRLKCSKSANGFGCQLS